MVDFPSHGVCPPSYNSLHKNFIWHINLQKYIWLNAFLLYRSCLGCIPRISVQQPTFSQAVGLCQSILHHFHHHLVWHQGTLVHKRFGFLAGWRRMFNFGTQDVPHGDMYKVVLQAQTLFYTADCATVRNNLVNHHFSIDENKQNRCSLQR